jgi:hypothetical protein
LFGLAADTEIAAGFIDVPSAVTAQTIRQSANRNFQPLMLLIFCSFNIVDSPLNIF